MKKPAQEDQVIEALRKQGGYATLRRLNEVMDFSSWKTLTPEASVRRIVQLSDSIFKIQPGLWALEEARDEVLKKFKISDGNKFAIGSPRHIFKISKIFRIFTFGLAWPFQDIQKKEALC